MDLAVDHVFDALYDDNLREGTKACCDISCYELKVDRVIEQEKEPDWSDKK